MNNMKLNVLGTDYTVSMVKEKDDEKLLYLDGYCDFSVKKIVVKDFVPDELDQKDLKVIQSRILRHEVIHAFLYESGLNTSSNWAENEEMIDFFAIQFPKMAKVFGGAKCER